MDTIEKLNTLNKMLIDIIALDNTQYNQLTESEEITLFRIYVEIFSISHKNDIKNINSKKEE